MNGVTSIERRVCADCGETFTLTAADIEYFLRRGLQIPRRCEPCRHERRRQVSSPDTNTIVHKGGSR